MKYNKRICLLISGISWKRKICTIVEVAKNISDKNNVIYTLDKLIKTK